MRCRRVGCVPQKQQMEQSPGARRAGLRRCGSRPSRPRVRRCFRPKNDVDGVGTTALTELAAVRPVPKLHRSLKEPFDACDEVGVFIFLALARPQTLVWLETTQCRPSEADVSWANACRYSTFNGSGRSVGTVKAFARCTMYGHDLQVYCLTHVVDHEYECLN